MTADKIRARMQAREAQIKRLKDKRDQANGHKQVARADELTIEINKLQLANRTDEDLLVFVETPRQAQPGDGKDFINQVRQMTAPRVPATG